jgi:hypothetical protein
LIVIDEYLAVRVVRGNWPNGLPDDDDLLLPMSRHWRLLQRVHKPGGGQLSQLLGTLSPTDQDTIRYPHPEVLQVADPRLYLDKAADLAGRYGGGWLTAETLAVGLTNGRALWFGTERNIGGFLRSAAEDFGLAVNVAA